MIYEHLIFIILSINSSSFMSHFKKRFKEFKYFWKIKKKNFKYNLIFKFTKFALKQKHKILVKLVIYTHICQRITDFYGEERQGAKGEHSSYNNVTFRLT